MMAGIVGIRAEDMEQVDALRKLRLEYPNGFPLVRPSVKMPVLVRKKEAIEAVVARFGFTNAFGSFNARSEGMRESRFWKGFFGKSHAIAPISYCVEWITRGGVKQPYMLQRADGTPILAPALFGASKDHPGDSAFAICTRAPNRFFGHFHDRMVGVCDAKLMDRWLHPADHSPEDLLDCVAAPRDDELVAVPGSPEIQKRKSGDWSPLKAVGPPVTWKDVEQEIAAKP